MSAAAGLSMNDERLAAALEWFDRLREAPDAAELVSEWLQWCEEHPDNSRIYREVQEIWSLAGDAGGSAWPAAEDVRHDPYTGEVSIAEYRRISSPTSSRARRRVGVRAVWALAASVVLAVGFWQFAYPWLVGPDSGAYMTDRGMTRQIRLADGSVVALGGDSRIRIAYSDARRDIHLERGEAYFKVEKDRARPFIVRAPELQVTAVGTAFSVRTDDIRTVVAVTEGLVEVAQTAPSQLDAASRSSVAQEQVRNGARASATSQAIRAQAGEQVTYDSRSDLPSVRPIDIAMAIGWQDGALIHVDEPLSAVVARVNRYSRNEVILADPALGELRFTGTVFENQVVEWAAGLERVFPLRVVERPDGSLILEAHR